MVQRALDAGIQRLVTVGTSLESSARAVALAERFDPIFAVVGWHPGDAELAPENIVPQLRDLARHPKTVALGETGLDYYRLPGKTDPNRLAEDSEIKGKQAELFRQHLQVAAETGLNCVIHTRESMEDTLALFIPFAKQVRAVFHCFVDGVGTMERIFAVNSIVSFT